MVFPINEAWLAMHEEAVLEPELPIIDAHHHLWETHGRYMLEEFMEDVAGGHRIVASIFCQSEDGYDDEAPLALQPVGETRRVAMLAEQCRQQGRCEVARGIIAYGDLMLGAAVAEVLDAHLEAAPGRFCGIRHVAARDEAFAARMPHQPPARMLSMAYVREACLELQRRNLVFEAWVYHPQLNDVLELARSMPELRIVLDHVGGPLGAGPYRGKRDEVYREWTRSMAALAACENVWVKLGGLGMPIGGFDFHKRDRPPSSDELANAWSPFIEPVISMFGAERCMFQSNFPVDKLTCSYTVIWNAFKKMAAGASEIEKLDLFHNSALAAYQLK